MSEFVNNYHRDIQEEFFGYKKTIRPILAIELENQGHIEVRSIYYGKTSFQEVVMIYSIFVGSDDFYSQLNPYKQLIFIALNDREKIVGVRRTYLEKENGWISAHGEIVVGERMKGYALPLELAHFDALTQVATQRGKKVVYTIDNDNKRQISRHTDLDLKKQKINEQSRWLSLYGPDGKLGFSKYGIKAFNPSAEEIRDGDVEITYEEIIRDGRTIIKPTYTVVESALTQKDKLLHVCEQLLPQLE